MEEEHTSPKRVVDKKETLVSQNIKHYGIDVFYRLVFIFVTLHTVLKYILNTFGSLFTVSLNISMPG